MVKMASSDHSRAFGTFGEFLHDAVLQKIDSSDCKKSTQNDTDIAGRLFTDKILRPSFGLVTIETLVGWTHQDDLFAEIPQIIFCGSKSLSIKLQPLKCHRRIYPYRSATVLSAPGVYIHPSKVRFFAAMFKTSFTALEHNKMTLKVSAKNLLISKKRWRKNWKGYISGMRDKIHS
ncbi:hypothetical protein TNCV_5053701 [Trichonephila clavipes]|nr:hypothetical protein TNCV_5053701 [Trichonephila clavipes]